MFQQTTTHITINDVQMEWAEFLSYEPQCPVLPENIFCRVYEQNIRHALSDEAGNVTSGGALPWSEGDAYISNTEVYREKHAAHLAKIEQEKEEARRKQKASTQSQTPGNHVWPEVVTRTTAAPSAIEELGFYGNVWVRAHFFAKSGDVHEGHIHEFDHVSFLTQGKVAVQVDDRETTFTAPAWITVKSERRHKITALEDKTVWWCVFALRDVDGNPLEVFDPSKHSPYGHI